MTETIIIALLSVAGTFGGSIIGVLTANKLVNYRIDQLEKKVEKHNNLIDRMYRVENQIGILQEKIDEVQDKSGEG